ncbi:MAG: zinc-ribbon domain-containing protein [Candidatus Thorarchaeota archaeon]
MKESGKCPKCGSTNLYEPVKSPRGVIVKPLRIAIFEYHVCKDCGYMEEYLTEKGQRTFEKYGELRSTEPRMCSTCGADLPAGAKKCDKCGAKI